MDDPLLNGFCLFGLLFRNQIEQGRGCIIAYSRTGDITVKYKYVLAGIDGLSFSVWLIPKLIYMVLFR